MRGVESKPVCICRSVTREGVSLPIIGCARFARSLTRPGARAVWDAPTESRVGERLPRGAGSGPLLTPGPESARTDDGLSRSPFGVDGILIAAMASRRSFPARYGPASRPGDTSGGSRPEICLPGHERSNGTQDSETDSEARLTPKDDCQGAALGRQGRLLSESRHGMVVEGCLWTAGGTGERGPRAR